MSEEKKLYRSETDRIICGLCGGLGEYFKVDSSIIRLLFILFFIINPVAATLFYIIACAVVPKKPVTGMERLVKPKTTSKDQGLVILGLLLILIGVLAFPEIKFILKSLFGGLAIAAGLLLILLVIFRKR